MINLKEYINFCCTLASQIDHLQWPCNSLNFNLTSIVISSNSFSETSKSKTNNCGKFQNHSSYKTLSNSCNDSVLNRTNLQSDRPRIIARTVLQRDQYWDKLDTSFWKSWVRCSEQLITDWFTKKVLVPSGKGLKHISRHLYLVISSAQFCELAYSL